MESLLSKYKLKFDTNDYQSLCIRIHKGRLNSGLTIANLIKFLSNFET